MAHAPAARADGVGDGHGAKLVWSPLSNLLLYGQTAAVYDALAAGVLVSLGTDWTPSGSPNLLTELKIADRTLRDARLLGERRVLVSKLTSGQGNSDGGVAELALDQLLVEMVTINPATTVRWDDQVGSIEVGKAADLLVIDAGSAPQTPEGIPQSPYRRLIDATERDVALVLVGGIAQAGDVEAMASLKPGDFEVVSSQAGCFDKGIDLTTPSIPNGSDTLADISARLADGLRALGGDHPPAGGGPSSPLANTWSYLKAHIPGASMLPDLTFNFGLVVLLWDDVRWPGEPGSDDAAAAVHRRRSLVVCDAGGEPRCRHRPDSGFRATVCPVRVEREPGHAIREPVCPAAPLRPLVQRTVRRALAGC